MARAPAQSASLSPPQAQSQSASLWQHAWRRLRRNKLAVAGGSAIIFLALLAIVVQSSASCLAAEAKVLSAPSQEQWLAA